MIPFVIIYMHIYICLYVYIYSSLPQFQYWQLRFVAHQTSTVTLFSFLFFYLSDMNCAPALYMYVYVCVCVWIYIFISQSVTISCQCTDMDTLAEFIDNFSWFFSTYSFSLFSLYIFFLIFSLHFPHLPRCRCAQQVTGEWSWWWWWWSCWRGDSNCWQARPKCSALRCVSRRYKDTTTTTTTTQTRTITRREAHFRLPSTDVPHSATYAANSSSTRYPLRLWLVTRCCRSRCFAVRCSLLSAASLTTSQWTSSSCSTNSSAEARGRDGLQEIKSTTKIDRSTTKSI